MVLNYNIPMKSEGIEGVLQNMLKQGKSKKIFFDSSPYVEKQTNILYDNTSFFCTTSNTDLNSNYIIIYFKDRVLYPTGYVIKSTNDNTHYLRGWDLLGSLDGSKWTTLHQVPESAALEKFSTKRYELNGGPFRYFKIMQTEPCLINNEYKNRLRLTYFDLFGFNWSGLCTMKRCYKSTHHLHVVILMFQC